MNKALTTIIGLALALALSTGVLAAETYKYEDGIATKGGCTLGPATLAQDGSGDPLATAPYTCEARDNGNQTRILTLSLMTQASGDNFNVYESAQVVVNAQDAASGTLQVGPNGSCGPSGTTTNHYVGLKIKYETHGTDRDRTLGTPFAIQNCA